MNCNDIRPLLSAYYDGEATTDEYSRVEHHLAGCDDCRKVLSEYRAIGGGMRALPVPAPPSGLRRDVWRAIETQQGAGVRPGTSTQTRTGTIKQMQPNRQAPSGNPIANIGRGWGRAIPAAGLIAAVLVIFVGALLFMTRNAATEAAAMPEQDKAPAYAQPIHIVFNKFVVKADAEQYTKVQRVEGRSRIVITDTAKSYSNKVVTISPKALWSPGATYEVIVDAGYIHLDAGGGLLGDKPMNFTFQTAAYTPTPTNTRVKTPTAVPTHTAEPTAIAQAPTDTPVAASTTPPTPPVEGTNTPRPAATNTPISGTSTPTSTVQPSATPHLTQTPPATGTATVTPTPTNNTGVLPTLTPGRKTTQTPGPRTTPTVGPHASVTPTPMCSPMPVNGFGKLWNENAVVKLRLGCPEAAESAILAAAEQHFQGGYMFWREDTHTIYVFLDSGEWIQYRDTWLATDPTPVPSTPPAGYYEPVRGFGKVWHAEPGLRQHLGWATDRETAVTGAWQTFSGGNMLWTNNRYIRVLYDDGTWSGFADTFNTPTPAPVPPNRPTGD